MPLKYLLAGMTKPGTGAPTAAIGGRLQSVAALCMLGLLCVRSDWRPTRGFDKAEKVQRSVSGSVILRS